MRVFLLYATLLGFFVGILLGSVLVVGWPFMTWLCLLALVLALLWRQFAQRGDKVSWLLIISTCVLGIGLGMTRVAWSDAQHGVTILTQQLEQDITLTGTVVREPQPTKTQQQLTIAHASSGDLILVSTNRHVSVSYGDQIEASGTLAEPETFNTEYDRVFDYPGYLQARGIHYTLPFAEVTVLGTGGGNWVRASLYDFKQQFVIALERVLPEPYVGLGKGLLLGIDSALGDELEADFRDTGLIHIVVLSGYNVMLVVAFVSFVSSLFLPFRGRLLVGLVAITLFALLVGLSATVVRASIMAALALVAQLFGRRYIVLRMLLVAAAVMLLVNPYLLVYDIGFQLSFMATLGLVLVSPQFELMLARVASGFGIRSFIVATLATQVAVVPLLAYQIGSFSLVALPVNVLALPMVPAAMLLTFGTGMVALVSSALATPLAFLAYGALYYITEVAQSFAALPFAAARVPVFSAVWMFVAYAALALVWLLVQKTDWPHVIRRVRQSYAYDPAPGWTIVEEHDLRAELLKAEKQSEVTKTKDVSQTASLDVVPAASPKENTPQAASAHGASSSTASRRSNKCDEVPIFFR